MPGYRPVTASLWTSTPVSLAVEAEPVPVPVVVQYATATPVPFRTAATVEATIAKRFLLPMLRMLFLPLRLGVPADVRSVPWLLRPEGWGAVAANAGACAGFVGRERARRSHPARIRAGVGWVRSREVIGLPARSQRGPEGAQLGEGLRTGDGAARVVADRVGDELLAGVGDAVAVGVDLPRVRAEAGAGVPDVVVVVGGEAAASGEDRAARAGRDGDRVGVARDVVVATAGDDDPGAAGGAREVGLAQPVDLVGVEAGDL